MRKLTLNLLTLTLLCGACGQEEKIASFESNQQEEMQSNGTELNGVNANGLQLNGLQLNGLQLNGLQLNGLQLNGLQLNGLQLNGSTLAAYQNSVLKAGPELVGTVMTIVVNPGNKQVLAKIDAVYPDPNSSANDVYLYDVTYQIAGTNTWTSLCQDANGGAVPGIPIANYWSSASGDRTDNPNVMTFACVNGAIGKCVRWGYRPWATATRCNGPMCNTVSLKDHHQACTRMVRADYCGDGKPNTVNGTPIDVYDGLSPQIQSPATTWPVEARWTPNGATCLGNTRGADLIANFKYPTCMGGPKAGKGPGNPFPACADNYAVTGMDLLGDNYQSSH